MGAKRPLSWSRIIFLRKSPDLFREMASSSLSIVSQYLITLIVLLYGMKSTFHMPKHLSYVRTQLPTISSLNEDLYSNNVRSNIRLVNECVYFI